ncbi:MAG: phosphohydrolase [Candidatus Nitrosocaldaceae archaeon]|nr:MAG: phosphohydrolase [Candidatus Nitrosocaldaceae archaeon]
MSDGCIIKGFIIPKRGKDDKPQYIKEFTEEEMHNLYNLYKEFINTYIDTYITINKNGGKLSSTNDINDLLNGLIFYIKSLLNIDPIPSDLSFIKEVALPSPTTLLRGFMINSVYEELDNLFNVEDKSISLELNPDNIKTLEKMINILENNNEKLRELKDRASKLIISKDGEPTIFDFPADTRIGSNTSSLIIHMLTTSSIATSLYLEQEKNNYDPKELQTLRLASMFHDTAKMYDWHKHQTKSSELLGEIFKDHVVDEAAEIIDRAAEIIKAYDERSLNARLGTLFQIFKRSDRLASSRDRLLELIDKLLPDEYKDKILTERNKWEKKGYDKPFYKWEFWDTFTCEDIKRFTEAFCREASNISKGNPLFTLTEDNSIIDEMKVDDVRVVRLDFTSIQSYIESNEIRVMNGASRLVDLVMFVLIPYYIIKYMGLYAENILYYGGGNCTLLIPKFKISEVEELSKCFKKGSIALRYGSSPLYSNFATINHFIDKELRCKKLTPSKATIKPNIHKRCSSCNKNSIRVVKDSLYEKEKDMCEECKKKFRIGDIYHFKRRLRSIGIDEDLDRVLNKVLEYISGHKLEELHNIKNYRDLAFIKFDGNILGQLMASSISLTDAHERSFRIDYSVKKAFHDFLYKLQSNHLYEDAKRVILGLMYMGGDDGALLIPSNISIPFALHMIHEYNLNMGKKSTLSIGISVGKPKHPINLLKDGARYLLEDVTKKELRETAYNVHNTNRPEDIKFEGGLAFFVADSGNISDKALESIFNRIEDKEHLSMQPYAIDDSINSISRLLNILQLNGTNIDSIVDDLLIKVNHNEFKEELKRIRNLCLKNLYVNINGSSELKLRVVYGKKESSDPKMAKIVNNLLMFKGNNKIYFVLYDLYQLLKVMGVEYD